MGSYMKGVMLVFLAEGGVPKKVELDGPPSLEALQNAVGGYLEAVPGFNTFNVEGKLESCVVFCNEEGKLLGLPVNTKATKLWEACLNRAGDSLFTSSPIKRAKDYLVGNIVVIYGDQSLMEAL